MAEKIYGCAMCNVQCVNRYVSLLLNSDMSSSFPFDSFNCCKYRKDTQTNNVHICVMFLLSNHHA